MQPGANCIHARTWRKRKLQITLKMNSSIEEDVVSILSQHVLQAVQDELIKSVDDKSDKKLTSFSQKETDEELDSSAQVVALQVNQNELPLACDRESNTELCDTACCATNLCSNAGIGILSTSNQECSDIEKSIDTKKISETVENSNEGDDATSFAQAVDLTPVSLIKSTKIDDNSHADVQFCSPIAVYYEYEAVLTQSEDTQSIHSDSDSDDSDQLKKHGNDEVNVGSNETVNPEDITQSGLSVKSETDNAVIINKEDINADPQFEIPEVAPLQNVLEMQSTTGNDDKFENSSAVDENERDKDKTIVKHDKVDDLAQNVEHVDGHKHEDTKLEDKTAADGSGKNTHCHTDPDVTPVSELCVLSVEISSSTVDDGPKDDRQDESAHEAVCSEHTWSASNSQGYNVPSNTQETDELDQKCELENIEDVKNVLLSMQVIEDSAEVKTNDAIQCSEREEFVKGNTTDETVFDLKEATNIEAVSPELFSSESTKPSESQEYVGRNMKSPSVEETETMTHTSVISPEISSNSLETTKVFHEATNTETRSPKLFSVENSELHVHGSYACLEDTAKALSKDIKTEVKTCKQIFESPEMFSDSHSEINKSSNITLESTELFSSQSSVTNAAEDSIRDRCKSASQEQMAKKSVENSPNMFSDTSESLQDVHELHIKGEHAGNLLLEEFTKYSSKDMEGMAAGLSVDCNDHGFQHCERTDSKTDDLLQTYNLTGIQEGSKDDIHEKTNDNQCKTGPETNAECQPGMNNETDEYASDLEPDLKEDYDWQCKRELSSPLIQLTKKTKVDDIPSSPIPIKHKMDKTKSDSDYDIPAKKAKLHVYEPSLLKCLATEVVGTVSISANVVYETCAQQITLSDVIVQPSIEAMSAVAVGSQHSGGVEQRDIAKAISDQDGACDIIDNKDNETEVNEHVIPEISNGQNSECIVNLDDNSHEKCEQNVQETDADDSDEDAVSFEQNDQMCRPEHSDSNHNLADSNITTGYQQQTEQDSPKIPGDKDTTEQYKVPSDHESPTILNPECADQFNGSQDFITAADYLSQSSAGSQECPYTCQAETKPVDSNGPTDTVKDELKESSLSDEMIMTKCAYELSEEGVSEVFNEQQAASGQDDAVDDDQTQLMSPKKEQIDVDQLDAYVDAAVDQMVPGEDNSHQQEASITDHFYTPDTGKPVYLCDVDIVGRETQFEDDRRLSDGKGLQKHEASFNFKSRYVPSYDDGEDQHPTPELEDEDQVIHIRPLKTCGKPLRLGLSKRQPLGHLHKYGGLEKKN